MRSDQFQLHARIEQTHWWFVGRRRILRSLVERILPPFAGRTIVDVGCGTGGNIAALSDAYRCYGIDTSREAIELARQRFPQVQFYCGQAPDDLGTRMQQADLVLLMDVLEHVRDDARLLRSLVENLTPGARLLITVPANASLWSQHDLSFGHYRRYDQQQFERLWASLPVSPCLVSYFNARLLPLVRLARSWSRHRASALGEAGTDFRVPPRLLNEALASLLGGERHVLLELLEGQRATGYANGVSLIAVLQRTQAAEAIEGNCNTDTTQLVPADVGGSCLTQATKS